MDDGSSPEIITTVNITFMNHTHGSVYVNNNGHISFKEPVSSYRPTLFPLKEVCPLIAIFWADINNVIQGNIFYRQTQDPELLQNVTYCIQRSYPRLAFNARWAFIATWDHVGYYGSNSSKVNTFQVVLTTDGNLTFTIFNYYHIQWTSGRSTGGDRNTGLGGTPAQAGMCGSGRMQYYNIPVSMTPDILHIGSASNINMTGRWVFRVDQLSLPNGCIFKSIMDS
ncbi:alpha-tectorin-like [Lissotriton helveticus]